MKYKYFNWKIVKNRKILNWPKGPIKDYDNNKKVEKVFKEIS